MNNLREFQSQNGAVVWVRQVVAGLLIVCLTLAPVTGYARQPQLSDLPAPGTLVPPSEAYIPVLVRGMTLHPEDPLRFDFILDSGNADTADEFIKSESERLIKYFMAALTVPKTDLWVNLSPHESDRIIPEELSKTQLGRDLLKQDYLLKQLSSSLLHPDKEIGHEFWQRVYQRAQAEYGTTDIPLETFNKVWIIPEKASVYENGPSVYVVDAHLKVMLEQDYLALKENDISTEEEKVSVQIVRDIIIPEIEREINSGKNFAPLRQIYHSLILAKWYKETIKTGVLSSVYINQTKVQGVDDVAAGMSGVIYEQYMAAYKRGVFNFIKEDYDQLSGDAIPRKYFSGGFQDADIGIQRIDEAILSDTQIGTNFVVTLTLDPLNAIGDRLSDIEKQELLTDHAQMSLDEQAGIFIRDGVLSNIEMIAIASAIIIPIGGYQLWSRFTVSGNIFRDKRSSGDHTSIMDFLLKSRSEKARGYLLRQFRQSYAESYSSGPSQQLIDYLADWGGRWVLMAFSDYLEEMGTKDRDVSETIITTLESAGWRQVVREYRKNRAMIKEIP